MSCTIRRRVLWVPIALACACGPTADGSYAAQQLSCVERAKTKAEADTCRHDVDVKWCVVNGVPQCNDAGAK